MAASHEKGRPLPKFGEWDVNNPSSADGFTVIFAKARNDKKATATAATNVPSPRKNAATLPQQAYDRPHKKKWLCCF